MQILAVGAGERQRPRDRKPEHAEIIMAAWPVFYRNDRSP
jgi:hypothetical protein